MAMVASQLVLHPVVSQGLKILSTTVGRDKVREKALASPHRWLTRPSRSIEPFNTSQGSMPGCFFLPTTKQMPQSGTLSKLTLPWGANVCSVNFVRHKMLTNRSCSDEIGQTG